MRLTHNMREIVTVWNLGRWVPSMRHEFTERCTFPKVSRASTVCLLIEMFPDFTFIKHEPGRKWSVIPSASQKHLICFFLRLLGCLNFIVRTDLDFLTSDLVWKIMCIFWWIVCAAMKLLKWQIFAFVTRLLILYFSVVQQVYIKYK